MKEDYSDLPPVQRKKKLMSKVQELQQKVSQEQAARDGLMKMKSVYEANSLLGDPMTVESQLNEAEHKLEKLRSEQKKYQQLLDQANSQPAPGQHSPQSNRAAQQNGGSGGGGGGGGQRTSRLVPTALNSSCHLVF
jgi:formin-binding protein 1